MAEVVEQRHPAVAVQHLTKRFGGTTALNDVSLAFQPGEIHALLGQNGSGKSTLVKILSGYHAPDSGSLFVGGHEISLPIRPTEATSFGFSFVHQDLGLAQSMTVLENVRIGHLGSNWLQFVRWGKQRKEVKDALAALDVPAEPDDRVQGLPQAARTLVAITRALQEFKGGHGTLLVLDEPTAYLPRADVLKLFDAMRRLASSGLAVVFVTHRLDEVREVADRASVLRDGRLIHTFSARETSEEELIKSLIGRDLGDLYPGTPHAEEKRVALAVKGLTGEGVEDVSFDLRRGEVLGLTGLVGMGHDEVPYLICGAGKHTRGKIEVDGQDHSSLKPHVATRLGIGLLPANRQHNSGVLGATIRENVTIPQLGNFFRQGRLAHGQERREVRQLLEEFEVRPSSNPDVLLSSLSGGNQQKSLLAKWMSLPHLRVLLLHEPTQGVDVGSKQAIFRFIAEAAERGIAVLYVSAEYKDLAALCDRVLIMRGGKARAELSGAELTEDRIVEQCYRSSGAVAA